MNRQPLYLSVDVGTGSARAALFTATGQKFGYASHPIKTRNRLENHYEQSSSDIWEAVTISIKQACRDVNESTRTYVAAIGIDATCSLVACSDDGEYSPLSVVPEIDGEVDGEVFDIMLWLDRRAIAETESINGLQDEDVRTVLAHFGNSLSPENEPPKLLWLSKYKPDVIRNGIFFDLADWVAFKCCGDVMIRSSCTVACKWGWGSEGDETGNGIWTKGFWERLGLGALCEEGFRKIGGKIVKPGERIGRLSEEAAVGLGLTTECIVASPMIDAHAGSLWTMGIEGKGVEGYGIEKRVSVICGTSTCFIQVNRSEIFVKGVWGPFRDAVLSGYYVTEGGQSVTGKLLENCVERHPAYNEIVAKFGKSGVYEMLAELTDEVLRRDGIDVAEEVHCLDYHAGNRSPLADPTLKGSVVGLGLGTDKWDLAVRFRAVVQALCYGARHIIGAMREAGCKVEVVMACGGLCKSRLFMRELADCLCVPVVLCEEEDTVLLGGAILGRCAHLMGRKEVVGVGLEECAREMARVGEVFSPNEGRKKFHDKKYRVYREMHSDFLKYRRMMKEEEI